MIYDKRYLINQNNNQMQINVFLMALLLVPSLSQAANASLSILNRQIVDYQQKIEVITNNELNEVYDDTKFNGMLNCQNGYLNIINVTQGNSIFFSYSGMGVLDLTNSYITVSPNNQPEPYLSSFTANQFILFFNCPVVESYDADNYFNKIDVLLNNQSYRFSFLLNCDPSHRHKLFEYGYLILAALDACILVGVALHSEIWSIKFKGRRLGLTIRWPIVLIALLIMVGVSLILYLIAFRDFQTAFVGLHYFGIAISCFFVFICFNEVTYLFKIFRHSLYKNLRVCEVMSFLLAVAVVVIGFFLDNWIYHNLMAICICVASIKLLHFPSLKQAFISKIFIIVIFTSITIVVHYVQPDRSYNDYATELSSPLFLVVPDLVHNLFKKCSWLFILDIIIPGVLLSYLRQYDVNRGSRWLGVYTIYGNLSVILGTIIWVAIQYGYQFSVPFSLVTYLCLMFVIFIVSWTRNEWKDLWSGMFEKQNSVVDESKLSERHQSFKDLVTDDLLDPLKKRDSQSFESGNQRNSQPK